MPIDFQPSGDDFDDLASVRALHRDAQQLQEVLRAAPRYESYEVSLDDGDELAVAHGLKAVPSHVSLTLDGDGRCWVKRRTRRRVTIQLATNPSSGTRTVLVGLFV